MKSKKGPSMKDRVDISTNFINYHLRDARREKGLTGVELAEMSDVPHSSYFHYELGRLIPDDDKANKIASALGKDVQDIFPDYLNILIDSSRDMRRIEPIKKEQQLSYREWGRFSYKTDFDNLEKRAILYGAIERLHKKYQAIIYLRYFNGKTQGETGKILGGLTKQRIHQDEIIALGKLRNILEDYYN